MSSDSEQSQETNALYGQWVVWGVALLLAALVCGVFGQAGGFDYVNYDDADNIAASARPAGLGWKGIAWAFTHSEVGRWTPLATISYMADEQFLGPGTGAHHWTNVLLHAATAVILFLALLEMTGALWRCAFVAAVFAIHPLRAEPVAWISERGELLCGLFFMLALWAYARYARRPQLRVWSWGVTVLFALGLMCKPMIVTLPFVLLLLDYWPLGRFEKPGGGVIVCGIPKRLIMEKIPLFALSLVSCVVALLAQRGADVPVEKLPFLSRIANALISCVIYLRQMAWPARLAAFYPHPQEGFAAWEIAGALLLLGIVSAVVYAARRRAPWAVVGWCWYLVMLPPVLGIIAAGAQAHADRYTYLPQTGLYVMVTWGIAALSAKWSSRREILGVAAALVLILLSMRAYNQVSQWRNSITLWNNTVENTGPNSLAENNLGNAFMQNSRMEEAMVHIKKALEINPGLPDAYVSMGNVLVRTGHPGDAVAQYQRALEFQPDMVRALINLGVALQQAGRVEEAVPQYQHALRIAPNLADAHNNLGLALQQMGNLDDAITHFRKALELRPDYDAAHGNLDRALQQKGEFGGKF